MLVIGIRLFCLIKLPCRSAVNCSGNPASVMPERSSIAKSVFASLDNVGIASFMNAGVLIIYVSADSSAS